MTNPGLDTTPGAQAKSNCYVVIDSGPAKCVIVAKLEKCGIPFIDVGMGLNISDDLQVYGSARVATRPPIISGCKKGFHHTDRYPARPLPQLAQLGVGELGHRREPR